MLRGPGIVSKVSVEKNWIHWSSSLQFSSVPLTSKIGNRWLILPELILSLPGMILRLPIWQVATSGVFWHRACQVWCFLRYEFTIPQGL
jgi:hypothetical protein